MLQLNYKSGVPLCDQIVNGFIRINSMGALLDDVQQEYYALWIQTAVYFFTAACAYYYMIRQSRRLALKQQKEEKGTDS